MIGTLKRRKMSLKNWTTEHEIGQEGGCVTWIQGYMLIVSTGCDQTAVSHKLNNL